MNDFMKIFLSLSVSGTLLILLILGLKPFYKNRLSRRWQYYIWLVAALRFLLPFTPDTTIVGGLFEKFGTATTADEAPAGWDADISINRDAPVSANADNINASNTATEPAPSDKTVTAAAAAQKPFDLYACLFFIWAIPALILFVRKITIYQGFIQYLKAGNAEISDIKILNLLSDCEEKLHIKTRVEVSCNSLVSSPIMVGFFHPEIVLPARKLKDKELSYIFMHELVHYRQRDMFYKWLIQIVVCAHWFNPFVYLLEKEVNKACELSCDEKVISILNDTAKREYGNTLLSFLKPDNLYKNSLASVTLTEGAEQLKERLGAIMNFKKRTKWGIFISSLLTVMLVCGFIVSGAYAANRNTPAKNDDGTDAISLDTKPTAINEAQIDMPSAEIAEEQIDMPPAEIDEEQIDMPSAEIDEEQIDMPSAEIDEEQIDMPSVEIDEEQIDMPSAEIDEEEGAEDSSLYARTYDYYRTYEETKEDIQNGYIVNTGASFSEQMMPVVTAGGGTVFYVNHDNRINISITLKNLKDKRGRHFYPITDSSFVSFEVFDPSGNVAYSFYEKGPDIEKTVDIDTELDVYPGEWRYRISFAYTTNGTDPSDMKFALQYQTKYEDDIQWLMDNKLNKVY